MTSHEHIFKGLCEFMIGSSSQGVITLPCLVAIGPVQVEV